MDEIKVYHPQISIANLAEALAKAQSVFKPPKKDRHVDFSPKTGGRVKYSYADLSDVIAAVTEPLAKNGLAVIHQLDYLNDSYGLKTSLVHSSGQLISTWYPLPDPSKQQIRAQEFGSALTYARRYSLSSLVGIASEEDDDGASAAPAHKLPQQKKVNERTEKNENDLDKFLDQDFQQHPAEELLPQTPLEVMIELVNKKKIDTKEMPGIIRRLTGREAKSVDLTEEEIFSVIQYINKFK